MPTEQQLNPDIPPDLLASWKASFTSHDVDGNGTISKNEIVDDMRRILRSSGAAVEIAAEAVMEILDVNKDGRVTFPEFAQIMWEEWQKDHPPAPPEPVEELTHESDMPKVELRPGVPLSPLVSTAWLPGDAKSMLEETWMPTVEEGEGEGDAPPAPPASFDPKAIEYKEMMMRLSKSAPLTTWNRLTIEIKEMETALSGTKDEAEIEALNTKLEAARTGLADAEAGIAELKASFAEDTLSLVPWMQTMFDLVDAGFTTFEVGGAFFPFSPLRKLFSSDNSSNLFDDSERVLGTFKRRCDKERGPGACQLLAKLVPNMFHEDYSPAAVEALVEKTRANVLGADAESGALDYVQLYWWNPKDTAAMMPTLKALQAMCEDKLDVNEETGEATVAEPKKIQGMGFVDFPARAVLTALQAGVPVSSVQVPYSIGDRSFAETLTLCKQYGIKVLARDGTMGGLISEKYLGLACPEITKGDSDLDSVASCLDMVNNYGGWGKVQEMLAVVKGIADKHDVKMQAVALRWQIDQGVTPVLTTRWGKKNWRQFGYDFHGAGLTPGFDAKLFKTATFLDDKDMAALNMLA